MQSDIIKVRGKPVNKRIAAATARIDEAAATGYVKSIAGDR
jgi:hypothetical protein